MLPVSLSLFSLHGCSWRHHQIQLNLLVWRFLFFNFQLFKAQENVDGCHSWQWSPTTTTISCLLLFTILSKVRLYSVLFCHALALTGLRVLQGFWEASIPLIIWYWLQYLRQHFETKNCLMHSLKGESSQISSIHVRCAGKCVLACASCECQQRSEYCWRADLMRT